MTASTLFTALSKTLLESCGQALLVWLALRLLEYFSPRISASNQYFIKYGALVLVFTAFVFTLAAHLSQSRFMTELSPAFSAVEGTAPTVQASGWSRIAGFLSGSFAAWISVAYLCGLFFQAARLIAGYLQLRSVVDQSSRHHDAYWQERLEGLAARLGITEHVRLYLSELHEIPFTSGFFKPVILFPMAAISHLTPEQVEAILLHELAHIRRNDFLFNLLQQVMKTFLFFNPFARFIDLEINREREYCCDDLVIAQAAEPRSYVSALLAIEQHRDGLPPFALGVANGKEYPLLSRIKRIMMTTPAAPSFPRLTAVLVAVVVVVSIAWTLPSTRNFRPAMAVGRSGQATPQNANPFYGLRSLLPADTAVADTIRTPRRKFKVVTENEKGEKKEYTTIREMPQEVRDEFLKDNVIANDSTATLLTKLASQKRTEQIKQQVALAEMRKEMELVLKQHQRDAYKKEVQKSMGAVNSSAEKSAKKKSDEAVARAAFKKELEYVVAQIKALQARHPVDSGVIRDTVAFKKIRADIWKTIAVARVGMEKANRESDLRARKESIKAQEARREAQKDGQREARQALIKKEDEARQGLAKKEDEARQGLIKKEEEARQGLKKKEDEARQGLIKKELEARLGLEKKEEEARQALMKKEDEGRQTPKKKQDALHSTSDKPIAPLRKK